jgi:hypothetical protein
MIEAGFWTRFLISALAIWRVTHLLAREDGPGDIVVRLRQRLAHGFWGRVLDCFYCLSLWTAAPAAPLVTTALPDVLLTWLALSGVVCLLERIGEPPLVMGPIGSAEGGEHHGLLRTETRGSERASNDVSVRE